MWISPNKRISPFCVDIHDRFGLARLLGWKEVSIQGITDLHTVEKHNSDSTMIPFIGRSLHADVVVRHWNTVGNIVETFSDSLCRKPNPF